MTEILEQLNNLKELGYIQKAHLNVLEVALEDYKTEIRTKVIDEFAEQLKEQVSSHFRYRGIIEEVDEYADYIDEIAEQMKGGAV